MTLHPEHPQPAQRAEVAAQGAGVGIDEDRALAEDRVAGEADAAGDVGEVVGRVAGRGDGAQRAELLPVLDAHVGALVARGRDRHPARAPAQLVDGLDVVEVVVGHGDAADPAAVARVGEHALEVGLHERAGIDDVAGVAPDEPRVGAPQREGARVVGGDEADVVHQRRHERRRGPGCRKSGTPRRTG